MDLQKTCSDTGKNSNNDQASVNGINACQNTCSCSESVNNVMSEVRGCHNNVNANSTMLANCSSLNELTLPTYSDSSTQIIGNFLKDLDIYFDLKSVPERLKLPLAARAIHDPFAKGWLNAEYQKLGSYDNFKVKITELLWNDLQQANVRCRVFQDKFDRKGSETLAGHYLRYVNLAASLPPPLSEYDLLGALTSHYPMDIQKCMISANLKSNEDALTFHGKMQTLDDERIIQEVQTRPESKGI